jgi:hypothetical protein
LSQLCGCPRNLSTSTAKLAEPVEPAKLAALWLTYLRDEGRIEATTINEDERVLNNVVLPELGDLRLREVATSRLDLFLIRLRATSASRQRTSGTYGSLARHMSRAHGK